MKSYKKVKDNLKQMEYNLTEPEILSKLTSKAMTLGNEFLKDTQKKSKNSNSIIQLLLDKEKNNEMDKWYFDNKMENKRYTEEFEELIGLDGSVQVISEDTRNCFFLFSAAAIVLNPCEPSEVIDKIITADIRRDQIGFKESPGFIAALHMLSCETTLLNVLLKREKQAIIMLDGPLIDPPNYLDEDYIIQRTNIVKRHLNRGNLILGCVKRVADRYYIRYLSKKFDVSKADSFSNDYFLITHILTNLRHKTKNFESSISTGWIDISDEDNATKKYKDNDIYLICFFSQKEVMSKIIRIDIPINFDPIKEIDKTNKIYNKARFFIENYWYKGQDYPLPVFLAHQKCNIRQGAAEVLYEEIITRGGNIDSKTMIIQELTR